MRSAMELNLDDLLDDGATFNAATLAAARKLAGRKPWRLTEAECLEAFRECVRELCDAYQMQPIQVRCYGWSNNTSARSQHDRRGRSIRLTGRRSVVTLLHLFAKCRQMQTTGNADRYWAMRWSINLFRAAFPSSFACCRFSGGLLVNENRN